MEDIANKIWSEITGMWKYRWWAAALSWAVFVAASAVILLLPDTYQASARVYVDTQSILKPLLSNMATIPNLDQQVFIMNRSLLSRTNIEKVIRMVHLDTTARTPKEMEKLVQNVTRDIKLGGTGREDIYSISYNHRNPQLAKDLVQALLTTFIDGSAGEKKQDSQKAVSFIEDQIKMYEQKLASAETALKEFKIKYAEVLPREGMSYATKLKEVSDALDQAQLEMREADQTRAALRRQLSSDSPLSEQSAPPADSELDRRLLALHRNLDSLQMQFTERHPDIVSTKRLIGELEERRARELATVKANPTRRISGPVMQQLSASLADAEATYAAMSARVSEYARRHAKLKAMLRTVPEVESQLTGLNRDYQVNKENYEKLINRREAARLSEDLNSAGMVKFRIIDAPVVPKKPAGPNRFLLLSVALLLALAAGGIGVLLLNRLRPAFMNQAALREITGLPVLGCVSLNRNIVQRAQEIRGVYAWGLAFGGLALAYAGMIFKIR